MEEMTKLQRLETVFAGGTADRTPILGGWIACPEHICEITGVTLDEYWKNPEKISARAYEILGTDGLIGIFKPAGKEDFRCVDAHSYAHADTGMSLQDAIDKIDAMPSPEQMEASYDFDAQYAKYKQYLEWGRNLCGDMAWMPAEWFAGSKITWFSDFGYENFFCIVGMYPDRAQKLLEIGSVQGHFKSSLVAQAVKDGLYPHAVLLGEDICTQRGPMISPDFIEKNFVKCLQYGLEPLLEAGCKPVWHCDGDVRPILDMLIDAGIQGCQGFQPECGMTIDYMAQKRTRDGEPLVIFGPLAVTTELPVCSPEEIKQKVRHAIDVCRGNANLVMFTANTINPDIPLENIKAMYEAIRE